MKNLSGNILAAFLLMGGMLLSASCTKEGGFDRSGQLIRFGTVSHGASTKTEYAGKTNDVTDENTKIEPIWWTVGDEIRIVSDKAIVTDKPDAPQYHASNYKIKAFVNNDRSMATLANSASNGLAWGDTEDTYTFYAVYPSTVNIGSDPDEDSGNLGLINASIPNPQSVVAHQYTTTDATTLAWYGVTEGSAYTVYEPDMQYAIMTAKSTAKIESKNIDGHGYVYKYGEDNAPDVEIEFTPAFTAFEFTFDSADPNVDITLTAFRMESTSALTGQFSGTAGDTEYTPVQSASKTLSLTNPGDIGEIKSGAPKSFTVFAMPQDIAGLTVYFTDKDSNNSSRTRMLTLTGKDNKPLTFEAGKKYRIKGLRLPGNKYQFFLTLNGIVLEWDAVELETHFSEQIQCGALTFDESALEMTDAYYNSAITTSHTSKNNNYKQGAPVGDGRWQVRTLNEANDGYEEDDQVYEYMTVTFTPTAPLGGYWRLDTHNNRYFDVFVVTEASETEAATEKPLDDVMPGRIMNQPVTLRIKPNVNAIAGAVDGEEIGLYFDCYFSANIDFDPTLDANTEFQDVHGNGQYSYWLITVAR